MVKVPARTGGLAATWSQVGGEPADCTSCAASYRPNLWRERCGHDQREKGNPLIVAIIKCVERYQMVITKALEIQVNDSPDIDKLSSDVMDLFEQVFLQGDQNPYNHMLKLYQPEHVLNEMADGFARAMIRIMGHSGAEEVVKSSTNVAVTFPFGCDSAKITIEVKLS